MRGANPVDGRAGQESEAEMETGERNGNGRLVTVFGGSGFVGRHVVGALARDGWRVRVACRRPDLAFFLQPLGGPGQVIPVQANVRSPESVANALRSADARIYEAAEILGISQRARAFIEKEHDHLKIAARYLNFWKGVPSP